MTLTSLGLFYLGLAQLLESVGLFLFISFGSFSAIIPWNNISVQLSLSSLFGSLMIQMSSFAIVPQVPETARFFFPTVLSLMFRLGKFYFPTVHLFYLFSLLWPIEFFILIIIFLVISFLFFATAFPLVRFSIFKENS